MLFDVLDHALHLENCTCIAHYTGVFSEEHVSTLLLFAGSTGNGRDDNVPHDAAPSPGTSDATSADAATHAMNNSGSLEVSSCLPGRAPVGMPCLPACLPATAVCSFIHLFVCRS